MLCINRSLNLVSCTSRADMNRLSPVIFRRCEAFHFRRIGAYVSGMKAKRVMKIRPVQIRVIHSHQRQLRELWPMKPPMTGPGKSIRQCQQPLERISYPRLDPRTHCLQRSEKWRYVQKPSTCQRYFHPHKSTV